MFKSIFFFVTFYLLFWGGNLNATNYYVSTASSGSGVGTSWANAKIYTSFSWSGTTFTSGDTVFFDGGTLRTDSLLYNVVTISNKSISGNGLVISSGNQTGHLGKAIFSRTAATANYCSFELSGCSNIKLSHLKFKWNLTSTYQYNNCLRISNSSNCYVDSCEVITNGGANCIGVFDGSSKISITNNWVQVLPNSSAVNDQCDINIYGNLGGHTITGNTLIQGGSSATNAVSCENIYIGKDGGSGTNMPQLTIANNFMLYDAPGWGANGASVAAIYLFEAYSARLLVFNNVISQNTLAQDGITIVGQTSSYHVSLRYYNNTVYSNSGSCGGMRIGRFDTLEIKNNIFRIQHGSSNVITFIYASLSSIGYKSIDYNEYYYGGSATAMADNVGTPSTYSWSAWQTAGYDTHSLTSAATFANINGDNAVDYKLKSGSTGINVGTYLGGIYSYDIEGTQRPVNGVDLGAYELKSPPLPVELTSFSGIFINNSIQLAWSTATETNNQGFDIEKNNNSSWEKIGFVEGKGNSVTKNDYSFEDKYPVGYTIQYRLKQIDNNGNFKYSNVITLTAIPKDFIIGNYPNPFNPSTKIRYTIPSESMINLVVYNIIGERIDELRNEIQQPGTYEINWNGTGHSSGIYLLSIIESPVNGGTKNSKTIKMNLIK